MTKAHRIKLTDWSVKVKPENVNEAKTLGTAEAQPSSGAASGSAPSEDIVRKMRNQVYGHEISDKEWAQCGPNWMKPEETEWLRAQIAKARNEKLTA